MKMKSGQGGLLASMSTANRGWISSAVAALLLLAAAIASAHVPHIEQNDYSEAAPFVISDSIEISRAVYAWFETPDDVDVFRFEVIEPVRLYAKSLVQVCEHLAGLLPWFAVVGPGLDLPDEEIPFALPEGYGAIVIQNAAPGEPRRTFYEFFSGKRYFDGPVFDRTVSAPGTWYLYYWDPCGTVGEYVAVFGFREYFSLPNMVRALINTPRIWLNRHLHEKCR